ncbi:CBS domain-containing protein [Halorubrum sp. CSM-61]|uniref:CBS domain-containing protein n=1 Tax=Halorubrum sp. CSM-61 TaxID=2485838 RepID=UPI000F4C08B6|nr:CBS domain-containing protein [Halorubrum sp. CSM-61]
MLIEEVMSTELVTCDVSASVRDAADLMLRNRVGSVVVTNEGSPAGLTSEADVLHAGYVTDDPFSAIPVRKAMRRLPTINSRKTLRAATERMRTQRVKKLVVVEGMTPVGIITAGNVVDNYAGIRQEVRDIAADADHWSNEGTDDE